MGLFHRKTTQAPLFSPEEYRPVIRRSICTGERVACMRHRHSGALHEVMLLRTKEDLAEFCRTYRVTPEEIETIY